MKTIYFVLVFFNLSTFLFSTIINVPADQPTIQQGIDAAVDADTVLVQPGTYVENINYIGKLITVASLFLTTQDTNYISQTIIDGNQNGSVVTFESGEDSTAVLIGFSIINGFGSGYPDFTGGGITCINSSPSMVNIIISDNNADSARGGGIYCYLSNPSLENVTITANSSEYGDGGGICCFESSPILTNVTITDNSATHGGGIYFSSNTSSLVNVIITGNYASYRGGGICCTSSSPSLENVTISGNSSIHAGGIHCSLSSNPSLINCILWNDSPYEINFLENNPPNSITISYSDIQGGEAGIVTNNNGTVYWLEGNIDADPLFVDPLNGNFHLTQNSPCIDTGDPTSPLDPDGTLADMGAFYYNQSNNYFGPIWHVSTTGSDSTGTGSFENPFASIQHGINIAVDADTVLVQPGTYVENINYNGKLITVASLFLTTQDTTYISTTIIDGNQNGRVVTFDGGGYFDAVLCGFTITNGYASGSYPNDHGGGIYCGVAYPRLENLIVSGNSASGFGGGIYCHQSDPSLVSISVIGNNALYGGGIFCILSDPSLVNVSVIGNNADNKGGGIYCNNNSVPHLENVTISSNSAVNCGGGIYFYNNSSLSFNSENRCNIYSNTIMNTRGFGTDIFANECELINIIVDTFTVMTPTDHYVSPIDNFTFDILHSIIDSLINGDVYVSVDGDDSNSGTSPDLPFKTITHAIEKIYTDSININTIHLASGVYSNSTNGEIFPLLWSNYVNLSGENENETVLDAENTSGIMKFNVIIDAIISNITITNGFTDLSSGVIYCRYSSPSFQNVIISETEGSGIYCYYSSPILENVKITGNSAFSGVGIKCCFSNPILTNVTITDNSATYGGVITCSINSNPIITNSILWNDATSEVYFQNTGDSNSIIISYTDIQGGEAGIVTNNNGTVNWLEGNIDEDPLFVDPDVGNFHLTQNSPCIDAGDPNFPLDPDNTIIDMGAFYYHQDQCIVVEDIYPEPDSLTISEGDNICFYISAIDPDGNPIEYSWELDNEVVSIDSCYTFNTDENSAGSYTITLEVTDNYQPPTRNTLNFEWEIVVEDVVTVQEFLPMKTQLYQNYPNPFNPSTTINYSLKQNSKVNLSIYNIKGQKVKQLVSDQFPDSQHSVVWNGKDDSGKSVSSGIYFYKMKTENYEKTRKMILMK